MTDFKACRQHMIESQLEPNGIIDQTLLEAFKAVPRELFLPESKQGVAYVDEDILTAPTGEFLIEPVVHARLLQLAGLQKGDNVLNIGDYTGYTSAVLSALVSTVITVEEEKGKLDDAAKVWEKLELNNIATIEGLCAKGLPEHGPFPVIVIHGSVAEIPQILLDQLEAGGKLVCVVRAQETGVGQMTVVQKLESGTISANTYFDASTPYLINMGPEKKFSFG